MQEQLQVSGQLHKSVDMFICIAEIEDHLESDEKLTTRDAAFGGGLCRRDCSGTAKRAGTVDSRLTAVGATARDHTDIQTVN